MQGPVVPETSKAMQQIQQIMPESKIILSTWHNQDVSDIACDGIIENDDPGTLDGGPEPYFNNVNRMIVSTRNGLQRVTTKYAVRIRTDSTIKNDTFIPLYEKMMASGHAQPSWFKHPIMVICYREFLVTPYLVGDPFHFGLTSDVLNLWDIPLATQQQAEYFKNKKCKNSLLRPWYLSSKRFYPQYFGPEQYLMCMFLQKCHIDIDYTHHQDNITIYKTIRSIKGIIHNFFLVAQDDIPLHCYKYPETDPEPMVQFWYKMHTLPPPQWIFFVYSLRRKKRRTYVRRTYGETAYKIYKNTGKIIFILLLLSVVFFYII